MGFFKKWLITAICAQALMLALRRFSTGTKHAQLCRVHDMVNLQIAMFIGSSIIWKRISAYDLPSATSHNDCSFLTKRSLKAQDFYRVILFIVLLLAHSSWIFFYVYLPDDTLVSIFSFLCLSVYIHALVFMIGFIALEYATDYFFPNVHYPLLRSKSLHTCGAVFMALLLTVAGVAVTRRSPTLQKVDVTIPRLPADLDGFSIVLLTDIHIGPTVSRSRIEEVVRIVNTLNADAITIVGDLVDGFISNLGKRALPLATLRSKHGTFFSPGNHEYYHGPVDEWLEFFRTRLNMTVLRNDNRLIRRSGSKSDLCFAGLDDLYTEKLFIEGYRMDAEKALAGCPQESTTILLAHQPNAAHKVLSTTKKHVDLILSGHTHGGQLYIFWAFTYWKNAFLHGLYKHLPTGAQVYVSSGVNYWGPPVKMWNLCEIVLIRLRQSA